MPPNAPHVRSLLRQYDRGLISPEEFRRQMRLACVEVIEEMKQDKLNPLAAMAENLQCRYDVARLLRGHSQQDLREVLEALAREEHLPVSRYLWNAAHPHIPLHSFFRVRRQPTLRIHQIRGCGRSAARQLSSTGTRAEDGVTISGAQSLEIELEYDGRRQWLRLQRDRRGRLQLACAPDL